MTVRLVAVMVLILTLLITLLPRINGGDDDDGGGGGGNNTNINIDANSSDSSYTNNADRNTELEYLQLPEAKHNISSIFCVIKFCEKYFRSEKAVIGSLVIVNIQNATEFHSQLIIELNEHANYDLGVMTKDATKPHVPPVHVVDKAKNYFVVFNRTSEVTDAINQWNRLPTWNPLAQVVALFINTYPDDELFQRIQEILRIFLRRRLINANVISYRENSNIVQAHTFYPYDDDNCATDVDRLHIIEECEYSDDRPFDPQIRIKHKLRSKIPNNMHGCPMKISASINEPYVFYDSGTGTFKAGLEVLMLDTIAKALKMTPIFQRINEGRENREVSNETGIYSTLLTRKNEILIGGMDNDARVQKLLWVTIPYIQDDQTWCVATARLQDLWQNIFSIYTAATWFALVATIFFNALIIYLLIHVIDDDRRQESYVWTLMVGMASALGQYATYDPKRISIRVMMIFLFMYGLVMSSSFNSFLISILTQPRFKTQVDSLSSAIENNFKYMGGEVALSHYLGNDSVSRAVRKNFELCINTDECLKRLQYDEKLAVAVSRLHAENTPAISRSEMFCFPRSRNIYSYSVAMPIQLDYHMLPVINYNIRQLFEFGLVERWNQLGQSIAAAIEIQRFLDKAQDGKDDRLVVLTVPHIMGAILIMFFGHFVALLAFCIELLANRMIQHRNCTKFWERLHWFLRPK